MATARYLIGIDLGTSNCSLSYVDTLAEQPCSQILSIPQLESIGVMKEATTIPSCFYFATEQEQSGERLRLDFTAEGLSPAYAVGSFALNQTALLPGRVVSSAKSWLCHDGVDREDKLLPWASDEISEAGRLSPVEVGAHYLMHLRDVWNHSIGSFHEDYRFENQEVTITVPASFDEVAQRLTLEAARIAEYPTNVRLIEEPQAAFYYWLESHNFQKELFELLPQLKEEPQTVLICDIGGGTTDFSLFELTLGGDGVPEISREAVSDHLLLGGDNIDLALAHFLEARVLGEGKRLSRRQWSHLLFQSRVLKERVLQEDAERKEPEEQFHLSLPSEGAGLFAGSLSATITRKQLIALILDGFFPFCAASDRPKKSLSGLKELGLPYAEDSSVTAHLAAFLNGRKVDAVHFDGGSLKPYFLQQRLIELINEWQSGVRPVHLVNEEMDLAVARGAAAYGWVVKSKANRIKGGYARSVYLELFRDDQTEMPELVCVLPKGFEEGTNLRISHLHLKLLVNKPVRFQPYYSNVRFDDIAGDVVDLSSEEYHLLPPLQTVLQLNDEMPVPQGGELDVELEAHLSEIGMLQIFCVHERSEGAPLRWQLEFNLRKQARSYVEEQTDKTQGTRTASNGRLKKAEEQIRLFYGKGKKTIDEKASPKRLLRELEQIFSQPRSDWDTALLRSIWPSLAKGMTRRGRSLAHETTWLYLAGFVLRPGWGADLDPFRMKELWRAYSLGLSFPKESSASVQWWIMWRRVAGGLNREQQQELISVVLPQIENKTGNLPEMVRLAGSLERIPLDTKVRLGNLCVKRVLERRGASREHYCWALGRLASRVPLYAGAQSVISPDYVVKWFNKLSALDWSQAGYVHLNSFCSQACRLTNVREHDLAAEVREQVVTKMRSSGATEKQLRVLEEFVEVDIADRTALFGEALPSGLRLAQAE